MVRTIRGLRCGHCGSALTVVDTLSGLVASDGWTIDGPVWLAHRGHHQRRTRQGSNRAVAFGLSMALLPPSGENGWVLPVLPAMLGCRRCRGQSLFEGGI